MQSNEEEKMEWPDEVVRDVDNYLSEKTVGNIMDENVLEVPEEATVGEVREEVRPGQIVVVENQINIPVGILTPESVIGLPHTLNLPLIELREELDVPVLAVPDTSLNAALQNVLRSNDVINWYVIRDGGRVVGVVPSTAILQTTMGLGGVGGVVQSFGSPSIALSSLASELHGNPVIPQRTLYYACNKHPSDTYTLNDQGVTRDDAKNVLCPRHGTPMELIPGDS